MTTRETSSGSRLTAEAPKDLGRVVAEEGHLIDEAIRQGVREAILRHKRDGLPVVISRDGRPVWVMPEDLGF